MPGICIGGVAACALLRASPAAAYEFSVGARVMSQQYDLRDFRLLGNDVFLSRNRLTETLSLTVWDIGDLDEHRREQRRSHPIQDGVVISWHSYIRVDNDFGDYTSGEIFTHGGPHRAFNVIPELAADDAHLSMLYGYLSIDGIAHGRMSVQVGRMFGVDAMDMWAIDGAQVTIRPPAPVEISIIGGLRVRDSSMMSPSSVEFDGTSGADCQEYVEGATPGTGKWQLINPELMNRDNTLGGFLYTCPQRNVIMPTVGVAIASHGISWLDARLSYRLTESPTVGIIGNVNRLPFPDLGYYPNETGQAPGWGTNEERVAASLRLLLGSSSVRIEPWAQVRADLVEGLLDRVAGGVRVRLGNNVIEPELDYQVPTFDADSIFNAFAISPTTDARLTWSYRGMPDTSAMATAWARRYDDDSSTDYAWGGQAQVGRALSRALRGQVSAMYDDGYGGQRIGFTANSRWVHAPMALSLMLAEYSIKTDASSAGDHSRIFEGVAQLGGTWDFGHQVAVHAIVEGSSDHDVPAQLRTLLVLDLAFAPEM